MDSNFIHKISDDLVRDEGLKLKPYKCTAGKLTIGVGRNLADVGISEEEARHMLSNDVYNCIYDLDLALPWWKTLSDGRQRALLNMCFNLGITRLLKFKNMLKCLRDGNYEQAAIEALDSKWARQVGRRAERSGCV